ncbi:Unknown protein sequence [Pseudomonas coronafaciens pv. oryzae]|nr:Unknown protein sequence [Pseudomonas coronafaciens pv. oryzae]KPY05537.1 Unknown protein sequence [Pseudomonas coronafaciens pv. oryzae]RMT01068.1 hypothetical protein ALP55_02445 [Pseudomonas coronafaciens pv. oryzae]
MQEMNGYFQCFCDGKGERIRGIDTQQIIARQFPAFVSRSCSRTSI